MIVYYIVFGVTSLCAVISCAQLPKKIENMLYWICASSLILLSAVRDFCVGADTLNYCHGYRDIRQLSFMNAMRFRWEKGYVLINWILGQFFENERVLLVFMACFILLPIVFWIKRESRLPLLSLVVFIGMGMWNSSMFILRQWCAIAILIFSYKYIRENKLIPFLILNLIAMLFHRTAIVFILAYIISNIPLDKIKIMFSIPISVGIGMLGGKILIILNRFARISENGNFNGGVSILIVFWLCVIAGLVCFCGKIPRRLEFWFKLIFLAAFLQPIAFTFSNWSRVIVYFSIALSVYLPNFIIELTDVRTRNSRLRILIGIFLCGSMLIWFKRMNMDSYVFMN